MFLRIFSRVNLLDQNCRFDLYINVPYKFDSCELYRSFNYFARKLGCKEDVDRLFVARIGTFPASIHTFQKINESYNMNS